MTEQGALTGAVVEAANRIIHGDGTPDDAQLVAGAVIQIATGAAPAYPPEIPRTGYMKEAAP